MPTLARTLQEHANYPPHAPRVASPLYTKNHHLMIVEQDRPCLVCGVRHSTLSDPAQNPYGATQMETHHHVIELAFTNAVDLAKFNAHMVPGLLHHTGNQDKYGHDFTQAEMEEWISGDVDQLWVLCDLHHRHPLIGIHAITGPIWGAQGLLKDGFDLTGFVPMSPVEGAQLAALPTTTGVPEPVAAPEPLSSDAAALELPVADVAP